MLDTKNIRKVKYGNNMRYTFGKTREVMELPYLLEIQVVLLRKELFLRYNS